jgi:hypothetical protein
MTKDEKDLAVFKGLMLVKCQKIPPLGSYLFNVSNFYL